MYRKHVVVSIFVILFTEPSFRKPSHSNPPASLGPALSKGPTEEVYLSNPAAGLVTKPTPLIKRQFENGYYPSVFLPPLTYPKQKEVLSMMRSPPPTSFSSHQACYQP